MSFSQERASIGSSRTPVGEGVSVSSTNCIDSVALRVDILVKQRRSDDDVRKQVIGEPVVIGGRQLSLSRAVRAGDFVFLTGQVPLRDGVPMTDGTIEEQTHVVLRDIEKTRRRCGLRAERCGEGDGSVDRSGRFPRLQTLSMPSTSPTIHLPARPW